MPCCNAAFPNLCNLFTRCEHAGTMPLPTPLSHPRQARVEAAGGQILFWNGVRVMGVLAVSRAIGDHCLRPFVIAQPEVSALTRCAHSQRRKWFCSF